MQPILKLLILAFLVFFPILTTAQSRSSGISVSANIRTKNTSWDYNLGYTLSSSKMFVSAGAVYVGMRNIVLPPPYTIEAAMFPPSGFEYPRYGLFAEYGVFPNQNDSLLVRPYFSLMAATKFYRIHQNPIQTETSQKVLENEINIGYGLKVNIVKRLEFFSRFGFGVSHYSFKPAEILHLPHATDLKGHFDIRFGTTYYITR